MKKGVVASIVLSIVLTLTLAITTVATAFGGSVTPEPSVYLAYRTGDICTELDDYKSINFSFDVNNEASMIVYNAETNKYEANAEGTFSGTAVKINGKTCDITIDVFEQGNGTVASPWVLANANHVNELSDLVNADNQIVLGEDFVCEVKADISMANTNFKPIGDRNHVFKGTINGNGKTISNIAINIDATNYRNYLTVSNLDGADEGFIDIAFIGNANGATINNLNIDNMSVNISENVVSAIENQISTDSSVLGIERLRRVSVAGLVAYGTDTQILGNDNSFVNISINSFSYANDFGETVSAGIGGIIGVARGATIKDYKVNARLIVNQNTITGTLAGGVAGFTTSGTARTVIDNVNVTLTSNTIYNNSAYIAGVVSEAYRTDISNVVIAGIGVAGNERFDNVVAEQIKTEVAGAVVALGTGSTLQNVVVDNASVDVKAFVAGIVIDNFGTITNASFKGNLTGYSVAGIVINNEGEVVYTSEFNNGIAVTGTLRGVRVGGVANENTGIINGLAGENKVIVSPIIRSVSAVVTNAEAVTAIREAYIAGLAVVNSGAGEISNFKVQATLYDGLNMAGLVSIMGNQDNTVSTASIHDIEAQVSITSNNLTSNNSTTYSIGGAVGFAYNGATIENNTLSVFVNKNALASRNYGVAQLGGLVARIYEDGVRIIGNTVSGYMFANTSWYETTITDDEGNNPVNYKSMLVGGLVGSIAGFGNSVDDNANPIDSHALIDLTSATIISNNTVAGLEINIAYTDNGVGENGKRIRSLGSFIGSIANLSGGVNLNSNVINGLIIRADSATFSYVSDYLTDRYIDKDGGVYGSANIDGTILDENVAITNREYFI